MSYEVFGDGDDDRGFTDEHVADIGAACFRRGAQITREMLARFVEQGGDTTTACSIRANWNPEWGADPGRPNDAEYDEIRRGFDPMRESY
jgi:hypothetical protein